MRKYRDDGRGGLQFEERPFVVMRDGAAVNLTATPIALEGEGGTTRGFIGVGPRPTIETMNPIAASGRAVTDIWQLSTGSLKALGSFFAPKN